MHVTLTGGRRGGPSLPDRRGYRRFAGFWPGPRRAWWGAIKQESVPGRITLKEQTNTVRRSHSLNPHNSADAVPAGRVRRRQNEEG